MCDLEMLLCLVVVLKGATHATSSSTAWWCGRAEEEPREERTKSGVARAAGGQADAAAGPGGGDVPSGGRSRRPWKRCTTPATRGRRMGRSRRRDAVPRVAAGCRKDAVAVAWHGGAIGAVLLLGLRQRQLRVVTVNARGFTMITAELSGKAMADHVHLWLEHSSQGQRGTMAQRGGRDRRAVADDAVRERTHRRWMVARLRLQIARREAEQASDRSASTSPLRTSRARRRGP